MKVLLAQFIFESNTFNPAPAELELFTRGGTWLTDEAAVRRWCATSDSQLAGSLAVLEGAGCETHPVLVAGCGTPAGRLSAACWGTIRTALLDGLRRAGPADVMLLHLHGAACAAGEDDVEGALLEAVRRDLGFAGRLVVSLDLHANVTRRMLTHAEAITAYRTMPHTDFRATGERAARLVLAAGPTRRTLVKLAALIPPTDTHDGSGRFAEILHAARRIEAEPGILDVSVFPVQPWLDVEEMGTGIVITSQHDTAPLAAAQALAERWYAQRSEWRTGLRPWEEILATLRRRGSHPWILVDTADATTAGADGRSAEAVARLWPLRDELPGEVLLWVVDPAARAAVARGERALRIGTQRVPVTGTVGFSGEARFRARGRAYHGQEFGLGPAVVLSAGQLRIAISDGGALCADPAFYECMGLQPADALAVQVKSLMGWRAGYEAPAESGLAFDGPGLASLNFARLPFTGPRRDLFPLNPAPAQPFSSWQSN
jgi:microcystin degradation protein MlrC